MSDSRAATDVLSALSRGVLHVSERPEDAASRRLASLTLRAAALEARLFVTFPSCFLSFTFLCVWFDLNACNPADVSSSRMRRRRLRSPRRPRPSSLQRPSPRLRRPPGRRYRRSSSSSWNRVCRPQPWRSGAASLPTPRPRPQPRSGLRKPLRRRRGGSQPKPPG